MGYAIQATVAAWLMATLTTSALMVALVQTASTLPTLLFGLAAGALADIADRRRIILVTQFMLVAVTAVLGVAELLGIVGPFALLAATFVIGAGFTFYLPAQQASINDLVGRADLARAIGLGAAAFNIARAIGPAIAGAMAAWLGSGSALLAGALCFVAMIFALRALKRREAGIPGVRDTLLSGIRSGLRYARHSPPMRAVINRSVTFSLCASGLWALLPVIARDQFGLGAGGFGMLSASFGIGAIVGALVIPRQLHRVSLNTTVTAGFYLWMIATLLIAWTDAVAVAVIGTCAAGVAWVAVFSSLTAGTQSAAPSWVRARAVAMTMVAMQASLAMGSVIWGWVASHSDTRTALGASAVAMLLLLGVSYRVSVRMGEEAEVTPGMQLPELTISVEPLPDDGPVLIQVQYQIDPANRDAFLRAIHAMEPSRRRNGASDWRVFRDIGVDGRFVERFILTSWAEYVRLRTRMTLSDRRANDRVEQFQRQDVPILVSRLISTRSSDNPPEKRREEFD